LPPNFSAAPLELTIPIPGAIQAENAGIAVLALKTAFPNLGDAAIRRGLEGLIIPARFEKIAKDPPVIIDGAHTPESVALCADTFCSLYGEGAILLFGCAADKDVAGMAEILIPRFSHVFVTMPGTFKISEPEKAYRAFLESSRGSVKVSYIEDTGEAMRQAVEEARKNRLPVLCTGSFYLVSDVRAMLLSD